MPMTEPQKEYIITEEQLLEIGGFADYRDDSSYREMRELQDEIRSHPHSSAKESSDKVLEEIENGISAYIKEHKHQQAADNKGIYIPVNVVRRLIQVRKGKHRQQQERERP